jgi:hypothetical protein
MVVVIDTGPPTKRVIFWMSLGASALIVTSLLLVAAADGVWITTVPGSPDVAGGI